MTRAHKKAIESVAENLLKTTSSNSLPVDVQKIAEAAGLRVEYFPFPDEVSGLLKKEMRVIGINSNQSGRRQRFTLAHEIGHYVLGHGIINTNDLVDDTNTDTSSITEHEANYFASVLLMPETTVKKEAKMNFNIQKLAETFNVSEQAMTIRVLQLGLIK